MDSVWDKTVLAAVVTVSAKPIHVLENDFLLTVLSSDMYAWKG